MALMRSKEVAERIELAHDFLLDLLFAGVKCKAIILSIEKAARLLENGRQDLACEELSSLSPVIASKWADANKLAQVIETLQVVRRRCHDVAHLMRLCPMCKFGMSDRLMEIIAILHFADLGE